MDTAKTVITKLSLPSNEKNLIDLLVINETPIHLNILKKPTFLKNVNGYPQGTFYECPID